ncbi:MAG: poly-gamma-glutamate system protein [Synergistaceae bacterium]|jgi:poly-gamma-glutamate system protein|nr:poly-gamma-glutamate system protein [Synergistaceae bacterium]
MKRLLDRSSSPRLIFLTVCLLVLFRVRASSPLNAEESRLYARVRAAQDALWAEMEERGEADAQSDPDKTGFIGVEWSVTTTTLGSPESKRNACDPLWAAQCLRWFEELGLKTGDRIVVLSSGSFPGMLYSVLAAAESRGLQIDLVVSLGSSTWGANRPAAPWPVMEGILRRFLFLSTRPVFYTLGGGGENGGGMPEEGVAALVRAARASGVKLFRSSSLWDIVQRKIELITVEVRLVVNIGGALSNLGRDESVISLRNGLLFPKDAVGDGIIALALKRGVPVLHLLNLRSLAERLGIDFETRRPFFKKRPIAFPLTGVLLFVLVLATHQRWTWERERSVEQ